MLLISEYPILIILYLAAPKAALTLIFQKLYLKLAFEFVHVNLRLREVDLVQLFLTFVFQLQIAHF